MADTGKSVVAFQRIPVLGGQIVAHNFGGAKSIRIVQGGDLRAFVSTAPPDPAIRQGRPLSDRSPLLLGTNSTVYFDFKELSAARAYSSIVVELSNAPSVVYNPTASPAGIAYVCADLINGVATLSAVPTLLWSNVDHEASRFEGGKTGRFTERALSGVVWSTQPFTLSLVAELSGGLLPTYASAIAQATVGGYYVMLDTGFTFNAANNSATKTAAGASSIVELVRNELTVLPFGVTTFLFTVPGANGTTSGRIAAVERVL